MSDSGRFKLERRLSAITVDGADRFESAMLNIYNAMLEVLVRKAEMGLHRAIVIPDLQRGGDGAGLLDMATVCEAMATLLRSEGLYATVISNNRISVRWPAKPEHWDNDN